MTQSKYSLSFLVIGAQKSGTTTLFEHLRHHPELYVPVEKEAPFFSHPERYRRGTEYLFKRWYATADITLQWGKITPQYMTHPEIPSRIASTFPEIRLIAILRDPIDRAVSHYRMMWRRRWERRGIDSAIEEQLQPRKLVKARWSLRPDETYVVWGEYGRILSLYYEEFDRDQLLILFTDDLASRPTEIIARICDFIGIERYEPDEPVKRHHVGGERRIPSPFEILKRSDITRRMWESIPPRLAGLLERFVIIFDRWNVKPGRTQSGSPELDGLIRRALIDHFMRDAELLKDLQINPPWISSWR